MIGFVAQLYEIEAETSVIENAIKLAMRNMKQEWKFLQLFPSIF